MEKIKYFLKILYPFKYTNEKIYFYHKMGKLFKKNNIISLYFIRKIYRKFNCQIAYEATLSKGVQFPHPLGIVIGGGVVVEENVIIYQNVTLGRKSKDLWEYPIIKSGTIIYSNSSVFGDVVIEHNTVIGSNSLVLKNTEKDSVYVGIPAKRIK